MNRNPRMRFKPALTRADLVAIKEGNPERAGVRAMLLPSHQLTYTNAETADERIVFRDSLYHRPRGSAASPDSWLPNYQATTREPHERWILRTYQ
jgi:hypothetical protein